jgi:tetratricopeptide (TPR) repeat protein
MNTVKMRTSVPGHLWYPENVFGIVDKAKLLERFALGQFLERCKQGGLPAYSGQLFEDMPSRVSRAEELRHVREDRTLEEIEILLTSGLEVVEETGEAAEFNKANLYNERGLLARLRCEWNQAVKEIETAIRLFEPITRTHDVDLAAMASREIGTAYYNLGDVYLARFRETRNLTDRDRAKECYQLSVVHDQKGAGDTTSARKRLNLF